MMHAHGRPHVNDVRSLLALRPFSSRDEYNNNKNVKNTKKLIVMSMIERIEEDRRRGCRAVVSRNLRRFLSDDVYIPHIKIAIL